MAALNLYYARHCRGRRTPRLVVARTFTQALESLPPGYDVKIASNFQAYRLAKLGVELQYAVPTYGEDRIV